MSLSIRWRLTIWYGAVLALVLIGFGLSVYLMMQHTLLARADATLTDELDEVAEDAKKAGDAKVLKQELEDRFSHHERIAFQVSTDAGSQLAASHGLSTVGLPRPAEALRLGGTVAESHLGDDAVRLRVVSRQIQGPNGRLLVQAASSLADDDRELQELLEVLLFAGPLAIMVALGAGYFLARRALAPVQRIVAAADDITAHRLDRRIAVSNPGDELGRLSKTLNAMIARLERSFGEIQQFTADAAHELRTPLTVIRNDAEVALRAERTPQEYRRVLENVLEETQRLTRLAEQLLELCREDAGLQPVDFVALRFDELVREVVEHVTVVAQAKGLELKLGDLHACSVLGHADRLRRVIYNLLDNAIKYTPEGGIVTVTCCQNGNKVELKIADTGCGIRSEHLQTVFNRFYRADAGRNGDQHGTGLGLAICRAIVESHRGTIEIASSSGAGTSVTVCLAVASQVADVVKPLTTVHSNELT
jgi:heavy metal sensor kinase